MVPGASEPLSITSNNLIKPHRFAHPKVHHSGLAATAHNKSKAGSEEVFSTRSKRSKAIHRHYQDKLLDGFELGDR